MAMIQVSNIQDVFFGGKEGRVAVAFAIVRFMWVAIKTRYKYDM